MGYREDLDVIVEDALTVEDSTAGHGWYVRRSRPAGDVLAAYLERLAQTGEGHHLGYVGLWHTHPLPVLPSPTDHAAMRTVARKSGHPVAMVVAARHNHSP